MGWSTNLFCNISFHKKTYNTKYEVLDEIDELNGLIKVCEDRIKAFALITEPKKFCSEEEDPQLYLSMGVQENLEELQEYYIEKYKLELLLDNWDISHKDGYAIKLPDNIHWDSAYVDGDFIEHYKDENKKLFNNK